MLAERDLVCVVGVRLVAIDRLRPVRVLGRRHHLASGLVVAYGRCGSEVADWRWRAAEAWLRTVELVGWEACYGGRGLEATELGGCVHLRWHVGGDAGLGTSTAIVGHATAALGDAVIFVEGEGVKVGAGNGGRGGAEVEDPDNLAAG